MDIVEVVVTDEESVAAPPSAGPGQRPRGLRGFHPGWFGAVMGTAVVGIIAITNPGSDPAFATSARVAAQTMTIAALALGVLLLVNEGAILTFVEGLTGSNTACATATCSASGP